MSNDWIEKAEEEQPEAVAAKVKEIQTRQSSIYSNMHAFEKQYIGCTSGRHISVASFLEDALETPKQVKLNVTKSIIDTIWNRTTSKAIRSMIISSGGKWDYHLRSKKLEKYLLGVRYREKFQLKAKLAFLDALICNIGYLLVGFDGENIFLEHIAPDKIIVDEQAAQRGEVTEATLIRDYLPQELIALYPEHEEMIGRMSTETHLISGSGDTYQEGVIRVYETWRLGSEKNPGLHTVTTEEHHLQEPEDYTKDYFPFVDIRAGIRPRSWIGLGIAEDIYSIQREIDQEIRRIQTCHSLYGNPALMVDIRSETPENDITEVFPGKILRYNGDTGNPPQLIVNQTISSEFPAWIEQISRWAYDSSGISELSAQGSRRAGNDISGFAYQVIEDIQSKRKADIELEWQRISVEVDKRIIDISHDAYEDKSVKVKYVAESMVETINWKDAKLSQDEYYIRVYPASMWPETPAGKIEMADMLLQRGLASPEEVRAEIYGPEMDRMKAYHTAPIDSIHLITDQILYEGVYIAPDKYLDLALGIRMIHSALLRARVDGAPEDRIEMLYRWLEDATTIVEAMAPEPAPQQPETNDQPMMSQPIEGTPEENQQQFIPVE